MVLDSGDAWFTRPAGNNSKGALIVEAMNGMGYDAMAVGPLDLTSPAQGGVKLEELQQRFQEATFALLSVNLQAGDSLPLQPYLLRQVGNHTVAIIGVSANKALSASKSLGIGMTIEDPTQAVSRTVEALKAKEQADVVILLSNLTQQENAALARTIPGIDVIIGGSDASIMGPQPVEGPEGKVVLHATGNQGKYLGTLKVDFDDEGRVVSYTGKDLPLTSDKYADDAVMLQLLDKYGVKQ